MDSAWQGVKFNWIEENKPSELVGKITYLITNSKGLFKLVLHNDDALSNICLKRDDYE